MRFKGYDNKMDTEGLLAELERGCLLNISKIHGAWLDRPEGRLSVRMPVVKAVVKRDVLEECEEHPTFRTYRLKDDADQG